MTVRQFEKEGRPQTFQCTQTDPRRSSPLSVFVWGLITVLFKLLSRLKVEKQHQLSPTLVRITKNVSRLTYTVSFPTLRKDGKF